MTLRLGISKDADMAVLFFPFEAGWVDPPNGTSLISKPLADLEKDLLEGALDVAPVSPVTYARNYSRLRLLPTPVRAFDLAADSVFLFSRKRLDFIDQVKVAVSPNSSLGEAILQIIAPKYYGITPEIVYSPSEAAALEALQGQTEVSIVSGEAAMRAAGWAKAKGYFVEDLTKAWWIMTGLPLPVYLFAVRQEWTVQEPDAVGKIRSLMLAFRRAIQYSQEQRPTLLQRLEQQTGLPEDALDAHYRAQRYDINESHLRGLLEFYRRAAAARIFTAPDDLAFFPALSPLAPAPSGPPRRNQPEAERPQSSGEQRPRPVRKEKENRPARPNPSRREEAQAKGLRVIKGGKDTSNHDDEDSTEE
ncbi:MAG TPA: MqnA/MqnD/SBP family protein [Chloroflexia bacterium]|nr:MqnA/MqnD/SBP family protein [Chloroflexia bacterium]